LLYGSYRGPRGGKLLIEVIALGNRKDKDQEEGEKRGWGSRFAAN